MVSRRAGRSSLGCLVTLLVLSAGGYFAVNAGEVFLRYYRFRDAFAQEARFANRRSDDAIKIRLRALADSLGMPDEAHRISIRRSERSVTIRARYSESVEMPGYVREFHFEPHGEARF